MISRQRTRQLLAVLSVLTGAPCCMVAPLILGTIFWFAAISLLDASPAWSWWMIGMTALTVPLLFRLEIRTGTDYLATTMRNAEPLIPEFEEASLIIHVSHGAIAGALFGTAANPQVSAAGLTEIFLFGPRLVLNGWRHLRVASRIRAVSVERAVEMVDQLLAVDGAVPLKRILKSGEKLAEVVPVLVWLGFYDWARVSDTMDRVYLFTESRNLLTTG